MRSTAPIFPRWLVAVVTVAVMGAVLYALRAVLTPVFFAFIIAYMLDPLVDRLEERKLSRGLAIAVLLTSALTAIGVFIVIIVPTVARELAAFTADLPAQIETVVDGVKPQLLEWGIDLDEVFSAAVGQDGHGGFHAWLAEIQGDAREVAGSAAGPMAKALSFLLGGAVSIIGAIFGLLMVPVLAAYLLYDFDEIVLGVKELIPTDHRKSVSGLFRDIDRMMSQFIRGQLTVMVILGALYAIGFSLVGVRLAVLIGIVAGMLSFIPYVGGGLALLLALLMWLLDGAGLVPLVSVVGVYAAIQIADGLLITPRIVGEKVGLSSIWVLLALMVGGEVFGFMGVLMAVPAAAVLKVLVVRGLKVYRESDLYIGQTEPVTQAEPETVDAGEESAAEGASPVPNAEEEYSDAETVLERPNGPGASSDIEDSEERESLSDVYSAFEKPTAPSENAPKHPDDIGDAFTVPERPSKGLSSIEPGAPEPAAPLDVTTPGKRISKADEEESAAPDALSEEPMGDD